MTQPAIEFLVLAVLFFVSLVFSKQILRLDLWGYRKWGPAFLARSVEKNWNGWLIFLRLVLTALLVGMLVGIYMNV